MRSRFQVIIGMYALTVKGLVNLDLVTHKPQWNSTKFFYVDFPFESSMKYSSFQEHMVSAHYPTQNETLNLIVDV